MIEKKTIRFPQMKSMFKNTRHMKKYVKYVNANMTRNQNRRIEDWISPTTTKTPKEQTTRKTRHGFFADLPF